MWVLRVRRVEGVGVAGRWKEAGWMEGDDERARARGQQRGARRQEGEKRTDQQGEADVGRRWVSGRTFLSGGDQPLPSS